MQHTYVRFHSRHFRKINGFFGPQVPRGEQQPVRELALARDEQHARPGRAPALPPRDRAAVPPARARPRGPRGRVAVRAPGKKKQASNDYKKMKEKKKREGRQRESSLSLSVYWRQSL